jgi:hypothetical protein
MRKSRSTDSRSAPESDTELTQNGIDFVGRVLQKAPALLLLSSPSEPIEFFFVFTLEVLVGKEPLPKAAAADFWVSYITGNYRSGSFKAKGILIVDGQTNLVGFRSELQNVQDAAKSMMQTLGPMLCQALAKNINGHASRSELGKLSEPVKKLVTCYPQSKGWLDTAFARPESTGASISAEERSLFVKKIIRYAATSLGAISLANDACSLRGSKTTNQVIRDFWLSARGTNFTYAS